LPAIPGRFRTLLPALDSFSHAAMEAKLELDRR
jgi:hypothetical protein